MEEGLKGRAVTHGRFYARHTHALCQKRGQDFGNALGGMPRDGGEEEGRVYRKTPAACLGQFILIRLLAVCFAAAWCLPPPDLVHGTLPPILRHAFPPFLPPLCLFSPTCLCLCMLPVICYTHTHFIKTFTHHHFALHTPLCHKKKERRCGIFLTYLGSRVARYQVRRCTLCCCAARTLPAYCARFARTLDNQTPRVHVSRCARTLRRAHAHTRTRAPKKTTQYRHAETKINEREKREEEKALPSHRAHHHPRHCRVAAWHGSLSRRLCKTYRRNTMGAWRTSDSISSHLAA